MTYLSFQDGLRQRLKKIQLILGHVEGKTMELNVKFSVRANERSIKEGDSATLGKDADVDQNLVDKLLTTLGSSIGKGISRWQLISRWMF